MIVEIFATTDNGQRPGQNEDNFAVCKDIVSKSWGFKPNEKLSLTKEGALLLVADGMGGANAGEVASDIAQRVVQEEFNRMAEVPAPDKQKLAWLKKVILTAHEAIVAHQINNLETSGMGTTVVVLWATSEKAYVAWCGDSRLYVHRKGKTLEPATDDHSYVWELVKRGQITPEQARLHPESNIITQSLGDPVTPPNPEVKVIDYHEGDRFLLCSDGLNSMLADEQINDVLEQEKDTVEACKKLIEEANAAGGRDNITVVLLDVRELSTSKPATTTTQELRKFIKNKNRTIVALGVLLISIIGYMAFSRISFPNSSPVVTKAATAVPKPVNSTLTTTGDLIAQPTTNVISPSYDKKVEELAPSSLDEEPNKETNIVQEQTLDNENKITEPSLPKSGNKVKGKPLSTDSVVGDSAKSGNVNDNSTKEGNVEEDSVIKTGAEELPLEMKEQVQTEDSVKTKKTIKDISKKDSTSSNQ
ncbi:hypothetical protein GCM10023188_34610 [Pontibacter saemangeumensis]|uniref:PPM-type phosphatase domain-containing protein n=1 Tax=Pontibacter saemangeumensis TaxID=1084525 RepID=A0ABP8LZL6_9BACT